MIVNCSVNAEHEKFTQMTVKRLAERDVPTDGSLFVISDNKTTTTTNNDNGDIKPSFYNDNPNESIGMSQRNESSQRAAVDFVLLPDFLAGNSGENRHENSKPNQSTQADPRQQHKRSMDETHDLCDTNECQCKTETKFLTVDCNFHRVSNFTVVSFSLSMAFYSALYRHRLPMCRANSCVLHIVVEYAIISMFD